MGTLEELETKVASIDIGRIFDESVLETQESLLGHNKMQLFFGLATDGDLLGTYAWEDYADFKATFVANYHAPYGHYNFYLHGDFTEKMYVKILPDAIEIGSTDKKNDYLESLVRGGGDRIFGLIDENKKEYVRDTLLPLINRKVRQKLNLN